MNEIGGTAPTAHVVPKSRHRSRYHTTSKLEAQTRRLEENHDDIVSDAILFDNELKTLDKQYEAVKIVREARVDARNVSLLANMEKERNKRATAACAQITMTDLRKGLESYNGTTRRRRSGSGVVNLSRLGKDIGCYFNRLPSLEFMFGGIDQIRKKRARRARLSDSDRANEAVAPLKQPKQVTSQTSKQIERMSTQRVLALNKLMKEKQVTIEKRQDLLDFLVCPQSFSETVENIFDFAHLVQRENAQIRDLGDGEIVIGTATKKARRTETPSEASHNENQIILGLDMDDWRALSEGRKHGTIDFRGGAQE